LCADTVGGAVIRKPLAPEDDLVVRWVGQQFSPDWASEARSALANRPASLFIAVREDSLLCFCCYDATARGFVGPIGVQARARGQDVGAALLRACLTQIRAVGYACAIARELGSSLLPARSARNSRFRSPANCNESNLRERRASKWTGVG
jgi:GNAT superfamily N-acetyltransferase